MRFLSARQAWHDAYLSDITGIDYAELAAGAGVQFSARGADNRILDHVEKGYIQAAVHALRQSDYIAYCWGMIAYAPDGWSTMGEHAALHGYLRTQFFASKPGEGERYAHLWEHQLKQLARVAVMDAAAADSRGGDTEEVAKARRGHSYADLGALIGVTAQQYESTWRRHYSFFFEECQGLPERALPAVAAVVNTWKEKFGVAYPDPEPPVQPVADVWIKKRLRRLVLRDKLRALVR